MRKRDKPIKAKGRPRAFELDAALDRALAVFWAKGFEGASLEDLTEAMCINRPSLYAAFGNKEALFSKVVERYVKHHRQKFEAALQMPTARLSIETLLRGAVSTGRAGRPRGCLLVQGALSCSDSAGTVRIDLASRRAANETALRHRFERAGATGEKLPDEPAALARFYSAVMQGMAVQHAGGATRDQLLKVVALAMRSWPE